MRMKRLGASHPRALHTRRGKGTVKDFQPLLAMEDIAHRNVPPNVHASTRAVADKARSCFELLQQMFEAPGKETSDADRLARARSFLEQQVVVTSGVCPSSISDTSRSRRAS